VASQLKYIECSYEPRRASEFGSWCALVVLESKFCDCRCCGALISHELNALYDPIRALGVVGYLQVASAAWRLETISGTVWVCTRCESVATRSHVIALHPCKNLRI
jgi:hypothetical protein